MNEIIDIHSKSKGAAGELSNFTKHRFVFDGVECASMEGFLQSLKYVCPKKQSEICLLSGGEAKAAGAKKKRWKLTRYIYWCGKRYDRLSREYRELIFRAYSAMYAQNEAFRTAIKETRGKRLCHSIGNPNPKKTILTEREFICMLYRLRKMG